MGDGGPDDRPRPALGKARLRAPGAGRPRKSAALHALHGTTSRAPGRGRNSTGAPPSTAAAAPASVDPRVLEPYGHLDAEAKAFWNRHALTLAQAGRLQFHHLATWSMACETWSRYQRATKALPKRISTKVFPPAYAIQRQSIEKLMQLLGRFGMDPATDARLQMGGESPFAAPPAAAPGTAAAAADGDRGADWLKAYGSPASGA